MASQHSHLTLEGAHNGFHVEAYAPLSNASPLYMVTTRAPIGVKGGHFHVCKVINGGQKLTVIRHCAGRIEAMDEFAAQIQHWCRS